MVSGPLPGLENIHIPDSVPTSAEGLKENMPRLTSITGTKLLSWAAVPDPGENRFSSCDGYPPDIDGPW